MPTHYYLIGDKESLDVLSNAFASWIQSLSKEQYAIVMESFVEQAEEEAAKRQDVSKEQHHLVFLSLFSLLLSNCVDSMCIYYLCILQKLIYISFSR